MSKPELGNLNRPNHAFFFWRLALSPTKPCILFAGLVFFTKISACQTETETQTKSWSDTYNMASRTNIFSTILHYFLNPSSQHLRKKNKREISQKPANWNENRDAKRSAQITLNMKSMKSVLQFARNATKIKFKGSHGIWVRLPIWTADFCPSGDANCFALENEWVNGEVLEIIKLNARHFRFNQPPATSEINSIHKSSQKKKKNTNDSKGRKTNRLTGSRERRIFLGVYPIYGCSLEKCTAWNRNKL